MLVDGSSGGFLVYPKRFPVSSLPNANDLPNQCKISTSDSDSSLHDGFGSSLRVTLFLVLVLQGRFPPILGTSSLSPSCSCTKICSRVSSPTFERGPPGCPSSCFLGRILPEESLARKRFLRQHDWTNRLRTPSCNNEHDKFIRLISAVAREI